MSEGYSFSGYHEYSLKESTEINLKQKKICILRHDVDYSIEKAVDMAEFEASEFDGAIKAVYFILLNTDFYNVFSTRYSDSLKRIITLGHEVGLHFDETKYSLNENVEEYIKYIKKEVDILSAAVDIPVKTVSMHRPSQFVLKANISIPGIINSYSQQFFRKFKYLSDSRHNWCENVEDLVLSGEFKKIHLLTHPFWYTTEKDTCRNKLFHFISAGNKNRYINMNDNFKNLQEFISSDDFDK
ncbi:hypothetical protein [Breznakiella homolactica]|uniref:NodB homology domain-containing protein n=1 Tax=Breznakiella homolactica TaxID=2798577 RepID=A0A7T8BAT3_9SPIR|nr:hypothetical protein [Breznakiella homolactica]QQO09827.1 hypothetical protein JFL75_02645 [Breznakiella homolactica]